MIAAALRRLMTRDSRPAREEPPFLGGLILGALIGAAIAGSSLWRRRTRRRGHAAE